MRVLWNLVKASSVEWWNDDASRHAAALAYYAIFSMAPILILAMAFAGLFFGESAVEGEVYDRLHRWMGDEGARAVQSMILAARQSSGVALFAGAIILILAGWGVFGQLRNALNQIWHVRPRKRRGAWRILRDRFAPFTVIVGTGFLLMLSLVLSAALSTLRKLVPEAWPPFLTAVDTLSLFLLATLLLALVYKILPDVRLRWCDVWIGAAVTGFLLTIGTWLIGIYVGRTAVSSAYGAAGSLVVFMIWINLSAQILFFGAEFTKVYARRRGRRAPPTRGAVRVVSERMERKPKRRR